MPLPYWCLIHAACYCNKASCKNMEQEPQGKVVVPDPSADNPPTEPVPELRPEDEAIVAERLRELGYIE